MYIIWKDWGSLFQLHLAAIIFRLFTKVRTSLARPQSIISKINKIVKNILQNNQKISYMEKRCNIKENGSCPQTANQPPEFRNRSQLGCFDHNSFEREWDCSLRRVTWYLSVSVKLVKTNTKSFISKLDHSDLIVTHTCRNAVFCRCSTLAAGNLVWVLIPSTQAETVSTVSFNHYQQLMATVSAFPLSSLNHDCVSRSVTKKTGGKTEAVKISLEGGWDQKWTHKREEARVERLGDKGWGGHVCTGGGVDILNKGCWGWSWREEGKGEDLRWVLDP